MTSPPPVLRQSRAATEGKAWIITETTKSELETLESRKKQQTEALSQARTSSPSLPANLAELYRDKVIALTESLSHPETVLESAEALLRGLIDRVIISWDTEQRHTIELEGRLAALLHAAEPSKSPNTKNATSVGSMALASQVQMVAGTHNQRKLLLVSGFVERLAA